MIRAAAFLAGFLLVLLSHTLAGEFSFIALAVTVAIALYLLFYIEQPALAFLIGFCLAEEAFGTAHFGLASTLGLVLVMLQQGLGLHVNFTTLYIRYLMSLIVALISYAFLLYATSELGLLLVQLALLYPFLALISYYVASLEPKPAYELL